MSSIISKLKNTLGKSSNYSTILTETPKYDNISSSQQSSFLPYSLSQSSPQSLLPNSSLFHIPSNGLGSGTGPEPGPVLTAEELSQRCREENDHFQRLLRMANM